MLSAYDQKKRATISRPYPATMEEAMQRLDQNEKENRAKGIYPASYAGKSGKRREASQDRYLTTRGKPNQEKP